MYGLDYRKYKFSMGLISYLTLFIALALSCIAEYFSIIGLASIFPGAFWSVIVMGATLGAAKLITASWLYRNWKSSPFLLKMYLTSAVLVLMMITSMGIFGYLSKAHIDSTLNSDTNAVEVQILDQEERISKGRLDYLLARAKDPATASNRLDKQIQETQRELRSITQKKLPYLVQEKKLTVEIGPIKYVADAIYGKGEDSVDKAVRMVILIIMVVFDPLAVLLLISANISQNTKEEVSIEEKPVYKKKVKPKVQVIEHESKKSLFEPEKDIHYIDTKR